MKILNAKQIQECDAFTIANEPISTIELMERASNQLATWLQKHFKPTKPMLFLIGSGNNGGDALAVARILQSAGFSELTIWLLNINHSRSDACLFNLNRLKELNSVPFVEIESDADFPMIPSNAIVIDAIFGSGLSRNIDGYWATFFQYLNKNAEEIIAIDIPSGLFTDSNQANNGAIIQAKSTLSLQFPKLAFMFADFSHFFGDWHIIDIGLHPDFIDKVETPFHYIDNNLVKPLLKTRPRFAHKGSFGHAFLVAGSFQKTGAAVLAAKACLRSGVGLLTVHVPQSAYSIMQTAVPEAMLCIDETEMNYCEPNLLETYDVLGIGPGIGKKQSMQVAFEKLIHNSKNPLVADADALNILALHPDWLKKLPKNSILTPHAGEFDRLTKVHTNSFDRMITQREYSKKHQLIVVLKGAHTSISTPQGEVYFNGTGNPGMATAGSGDVLTGVILALLAQKYEPLHAALLGVYLHGLAGDLAARKVGQESLIASDIISNMGKAFGKLRQ